MKFVRSCSDRNKNDFVNISIVTNIKINEHNYLGDCNIMFDDKIWRNYNTKEEFDNDVEVVLKAMFGEVSIYVLSKP